MRVTDLIVIVVVSVQGVSLGLAGSSSAVLCVEADGRSEVEASGCDCPSTHNTSPEAGALAYHESDAISDEECDPCLDIPLGNAADRLSSRVVSRKNSTFYTFSSVAVVHSTSGTVYHLANESSILRFNRGNPNVTLSLPLVI